LTRQPKAAQHARVSGIGILINPRSRRNLRDPGAGERLARIVGPLGLVRTASTLGELHDIADEFSKRDIDVLAISGGDGTNHVTLGGFIKAYGDKPLPPIAHIYSEGLLASDPRKVKTGQTLKRFDEVTAWAFAARLAPTPVRFGGVGVRSGDASKWVRGAALQHLGPFIASLPGPKIAPAHLAHYLRMGMPPVSPACGLRPCASPRSPRSIPGQSARSSSQTRSAAA
jgi:hypothetical protein